MCKRSRYRRQWQAAVIIVNAIHSFQLCCAYVIVNRRTHEKPKSKWRIACLLFIKFVRWITMLEIYCVDVIISISVLNARLCHPFYSSPSHPLLCPSPPPPPSYLYVSPWLTIEIGSYYGMVVMYFRGRLERTCKHKTLFILCPCPSIPLYWLIFISFGCIRVCVCVFTVSLWVQELFGQKQAMIFSWIYSHSGPIRIPIPSIPIPHILLWKTRRTSIPCERTCFNSWLCVSIECQCCVIYLYAIWLKANI